tara:strand:- start:418 stop:1170 length:753 start_codon:yes stop_codon:yes gene_type:complete
MSFFTVLPIAVTDLSLPQLNSSDVSHVFPISSFIEEDAYGHWLFGVGESDFTASSGAVLTKQSAGTAISFNGNYLTTRTAVGNALISDRLQTLAADEFTVCMLVRVPTLGSITILAGDLGSTKGLSVYLSNAPLFALNGRQAGAILTSTVTPLVDQWYFVSYKITHSATIDGEKGVSIDGETFIINDVVAGDYNARAQGISMANSDYDTGTDFNVDFAEYMIFNSALSDSELSGVYERALIRAAERGIAI